jgi:hypothetical protein
LRARKSLGGPLDQGEAYADAELAGPDVREILLTVGRTP